MPSKTLSKIAWILAGLGVVLMIVGSVLNNPIAIIGLYLIPLALVYPVIYSKNRRTRLVGIIASLMLLSVIMTVIFSFQGLPFGCFGGTASGCFIPSVSVSHAINSFVIFGWPSVLLLIVSAYSLVKKKK